MTADLHDLTGALLDPAEIAPDAREEMARMFDELAAEARSGSIENFVAVLVRSTVSYSIRCWRADTLRLVGACEAAKADLLAGDEERYIDLGQDGA